MTTALPSSRRAAPALAGPALPVLPLRAPLLCPTLALDDTLPAPRPRISCIIHSTTSVSSSLSHHIYPGDHSLTLYITTLPAFVYLGCLRSLHFFVTTFTRVQRLLYLHLPYPAALVLYTSAPGLGPAVHAQQHHHHGRPSATPARPRGASACLDACLPVPSALRAIQLVWPSLILHYTLTHP
ncbi:hypothetical protein B0H19DRAFT_1253707 [Mycena capillaripes]|nr:hypothetical protein B0H19DRAFT_1253707 [Mycena capillaripes]